ncbi:MAG: DUF6208 family protein [Pseudomonadota bacterium]
MSKALPITTQVVNVRSKGWQRLDLVWEILLAPFSFVFFKVAKILLTTVYVAKQRSAKSKEARWIVLDEAMIQKPLSVAVLLANAPRWNTHAIIAKTTGIVVENTLSIRTADAVDSAFPWTIVIYSYPDLQTITRVNTFDMPSPNLNCAGQSDGWTKIDLKSGVYSLGIRYYAPGDNAILPRVLADGRPVLESERLKNDSNDFYFDLKKRRNFVFYFFHYYVYVLLRLRRILPVDFVSKEYLPVGNPDTLFNFGALYAGEKLSIELDFHLLSSCNVYFCFYDLASFPTVWGKVNSGNFLTPALQSKGTYLIRVCATQKDIILDRSSLKVAIV